MELLNPTLTIQNVAGHAWLVRMQHTLAEGEFIDVQLKLPKSAATVAGLQQAVVAAAIDRLQRLLPNNPA